LRFMYSVVCVCQSGDEGQTSLMQDKTVAADQNNSSVALSESNEVRDHCSTSDAPDDVATSTPRKRHNNGSGVSPKHITVDDTIAVDSDGEKTGTPTSPKDITGTPRSSMFSKRAGMTPSTPPPKESRSKKSLLATEERPKRKGCCTLF